MLALAVLLALVLSAHGFAQFVSIPLKGETTGKAIEGNTQMVITGTPETGETFEYDAIPTIPRPMGIRMDIALYNSAVRPEADATLGVAIGVSGFLSYDEWRGRSAAEKSYGEKTRGDLRQAHLGSIDHPGRWITAIRTGSVEYAKQRNGQNGPLTFTAYIEPSDLQPGMNVFIVRVHGIMEQRTTQFLILGKDGKSIFGTYDEPWLINVVENNADDSASPTTGPAAGDYITTQELRLVLDDLEKFKGEIRAMLAPTQQPTTAEGQGGGGLHVIWNDQDISQLPTTPRLDPTPTMPDEIGIKFSHRENSVVGRQEQVRVSFDPALPAGSWVESATFANGQWWPWQKVSGVTTSMAINLAKLPIGPIALTVAVRNATGTLAFSQLTLTLEDS